MMTKTGKASTTTTGAENCRRFDINKKEWVTCDREGFHDGVPVFTAGLARRLRGCTPVRAVKEFSIPEEHAAEFCKMAGEAYLPMFDTRGRYRNTNMSGLEAQEELRAVQYKELNLPPEALQRLLALRRKKGLD